MQSNTELLSSSSHYFFASIDPAAVNAAARKVFTQRACTVLSAPAACLWSRVPRDSTLERGFPEVSMAPIQMKPPHLMGPIIVWVGDHRWRQHAFMSVFFFTLATSGVGSMSVLLRLRLRLGKVSPVQ